MVQINVILFFITLINIQIYSSLELNSFAKQFSKPIDSEAFTQVCYYDLKTDMIIKNYVIKIESTVIKLFKESTDVIETDITFEQFWRFFKNGNYGKIACELSDSEDYVRSYFDFFLNEEGKMTYKTFVQFMGLYFLEGELLVMEIHPTLSPLFPNEHNISKSKGCRISLAYWELVNFLLQKIYIQFKWEESRPISKEEIFSILENTHTGKCYIMADKKCKFFDKYISKVLGFMNMSTGAREGLNVFENKMAYSTFLFNDISHQVCTQIKFDAEVIKTKIGALKEAK
jgi:hypothetical protein